MNSNKTIIGKLNLAKYPKKLFLHIPNDVRDFDDINYDAFIEGKTYN